jgi:hypothetical protein
MATKERIMHFINNPGDYQDWVYGADPDVYTAVPIYQAFTKYFGREPTPEEYGIYQPMVVSMGHTGAMGAVAQAAKDFKESPEEKAKLRDKEINEKQKEFNVGVGDLIKNTLGRDATPAEIEHFSKLKASGQADDYSLTQALQTLPEYVEKQDLGAREKLRGELSAGDERFFNKQVLPGIQSRFAQAGRSMDSSSFASALANKAGDISAERENTLAGMGHDDYTNRRQLSIDNYLRNLSRQYQNEDYTKARGDQYSDSMLERRYELSDYGLQKTAYDEYIRNNGKRKSSGLMAAGTGAASGAAAGTTVLPGWGTAIGAVAGAGLGYFGSQQ